MEGQSRRSMRGTGSSTVAAMPVHRDVAQWRPATTDDVDALWRFARAVGKADHPHHLTTREGIERNFALSHFEPERDSLIGFTREGTIAAMGMVICPPNHETLARSILIGGVHPSHRGRGLGRELLTWQLGRAEAQLAAVQAEGARWSGTATVPRWILAFTHETAWRSVRLFRRMGLHLVRYFQSLERRLDEPVPGIALPPGVRLVPYSADLSRATHAARDSAFRDHWGSQPMSEEAWDSFVSTGTFRADLSMLAVATTPEGTDQVVGFTMASVNRDNWAHQGYTGSHVDLVGVVEGWRGRQIARALLAAHLEAARAEGLERVSLIVDSESETGALNLYRGMGFTPTTRRLAFTVEL